MQYRKANPHLIFIGKKRLKLSFWNGFFKKKAAPF
jgi:hypothetical protein